MPIDYRILQNLGAPFNPIDSLGRAAKLRSLQLGNQSDQQTIQLNQAKLDEIARANASRNNVEGAARAAYQTPAPVSTQMPPVDVGGVNIPGQTSTVQGPAQFDRAAFLSKLATSDPMAAMGQQAQFASQDAAAQKDHLDIAAKFQTLDKGRREAAMQQVETMAQIYNATLQADPTTRPQLFSALVQKAKASGGLNPDTPDQYQGDQVAQASAQAAMKLSEQFKIAHENAASAETGRHNQATEGQAASTLVETQRHNKADEGLKAQSNLISSQAKFGEGPLSTEQQDLVDQIGQGKMPLTRLDYLATRNPGLLSAVSARYPDFDGAKIKSYVDTTKDFTSGKTSVQLNAGGTALGHLKELKDLNTAASHIPHTPAWTRYQNKVDTVAAELAKFYGDATIPAINAIKETLGATLPGNRDAAIQTQAQSMGDKLDAYEQQWKNSAPSSKYQAPMPGISGTAKAARASLAGESSGVSVTDPNGGVHTFQNQEAANRFKAAAGIK